MKHYNLDEDEVVLFKSTILVSENKESAEIILTNKNFVIVNEKKKLSDKEKTDVKVYLVEDIKRYNGIPQIIQKKEVVELYFLHDEVEFFFHSRIDAHKFVRAALNLLTGKTTLERNVEKVKNTISIVDNSLGIDSIDLARKAVQSGAIGKTKNVISQGAKLIGQGIQTANQIIKKKK